MNINVHGYSGSPICGKAYRKTLVSFVLVLQLFLVGPLTITVKKN
jgi:hypothetical protein